MCQSLKSVEIVDDPLPQDVIDTVLKQIVDVPVLEHQEGMAGQTVDFTVLAIREDLVEVSQPLPQDCVQGRRLVEQVMEFRGGLCLRSTSTSTHCGADGGTPRATDQ